MKRLSFLAFILVLAICSFYASAAAENQPPPTLQISPYIAIGQDAPIAVQGQKNAPFGLFFLTAVNGTIEIETIQIASDSPAAKELLFSTQIYDDRSARLGRNHCIHADIVRCTIQLKDKPLTIPEGTTITINVTADILSHPNVPLPISLRLGISSVTIKGHALFANQFPTWARSIPINPSGSLSVVLDMRTPASRSVFAGTREALVTLLKFSALHERMNLKTLALQRDGTAVSEPLSYSVWIDRGRLLERIGEGRFEPGDRHSIVFLKRDIPLSPLGSKTLGIRIDAPIPEQKEGDSAPYTIAVNYDGDAVKGTIAVGQDSGKTVVPQNPDTHAALITIIKKP